MGEQRQSRPGQYWDMHEARWVQSPVRSIEALVPAQPSAEPAADVVGEADVRSG